MASSVGSRSRGSLRQSSALSGGSTALHLSSSGRYTVALGRLYRVMYTVSQDMHAGFKVPFAMLCLEHFQFAAILLMKDIPWGWSADVQDALLYFTSDPALFLTYNVFTAALAVVLFLFLATLSGLYYIARNPDFKSKHPLRLLRWSLQGQVTFLFVPITNLLLAPLDCETIDGQLVLSDFPETRCWEWPGLLLSIVCIFFLLLWFATTMTTSILFFDSRVRQSSPVARPSGRPQTFFLFARFTMLVLSKSMHDYVLIRCIIYTLFCGQLAYIYVLKLPYYQLYINVLTISAVGGTLLSSVAAITAVLVDDTSNPVSAILLPVCLVCGLIAGAGAAVVRSKRLEKLAHQLLGGGEGQFDVEEGGRHTVSVSDSDDDSARRVTSQLIHPDMVEVLTRYVRSGSEKNVVEDFDKVKLILTAGLARFPNGVQIYNHYANELLECVNDGMQATIQIKHAKRHSAPFDIQYVLYTRERMANQALQAHSLGAGAMDTISFVEFQKQFKLAKHYHLETLQNIKAFWGLLSNMEVDVSHIPALTKKISHSESKATAVYNVLINKFPNSKPLLQSYGKFQEDVKRDYDLALACYDLIDDIDTEGGDEGKSSGASRSQSLSQPGTSQNRSSTLLNGVNKEALMATRKYRSVLLSRKSAAVQRLKWTVTVALCLTLVFNVIAFVMMNEGVNHHRETANFLADSTLRAYYVKSGPLYMRYMEQMSREKNGAEYQRYATLLETDMLHFRDIHQHLYDKTYRSTFSTKKMDNFWTDPNIDLLVNMNETHFVIERLNLWDAGNNYINKGLEVAAMPREDMQHNVDIRPLRFLLDNNEVIVESMTDTEYLYNSVLHDQMRTTIIVELGLACGLVALLCIIGFGCFFPSLSKIYEERLQTLRIFLTIPKNVVQRIHKEVKVTVDFDEEENEDDKDDKKKKSDLGSVMVVDSDVLTDAQLKRRISVKFCTALTVLGLVFLLYVVICIAFWGLTGNAAGNDVLFAGDRRTIAHQLHYLVRELPLLGLQQQNISILTPRGEPLALHTLMEVLERQMQELRLANTNLKYHEDATGVERRSEKLFQMMYGCSKTECSEESGLDAWLFNFMHLLATVENQVSQTFNSTALKDITRIARDLLDPALHKAVELILDDMNASEVLLLSLEGAVFGVSMLLLAFFYIFLFAGMISRLRNESTKTGSMLLMIPPEIIEKVDAIKTFLYTGVVLDESERIQQDLVNSRLTNSAIVNHRAGEAMVIIDSTGIILSWNKPATELLGYSESEAVGKNITLIQSDEIRAKHDQYLRNYIETDNKKVIGKKRMEYAITKSGHALPVMLVVDEVILSDKRVYAGVMKDRAKISEAMEKAKEEREFSQAIVSNSSIGIIIAQDDGTITTFNKSCELVFGYNADDVIGSNLSVLMPRRYAEHHDHYIEAYQATGIAKVIGRGRNTQGLRFDGTEVELELAVTEVTVGEETFYTGFLTDQTEKVAQERKIREEKLFNEAVVDTSTAGIIVMDQDGVLAKFNKAACTIFQYSLEEVRGHNVRMLMPKKYAERHDGYLRKYRETGIKTIIGKGRELEGQRRDGSIVNLQLSVAEVDIEGRPWFVAFLADETERIQMDKRMKEEKQFNESIVATASQGVVVISADGTIQKMNPAARSIFCYDEEEVRGQNVKVLMPERFSRQHDGFLRQYAETRVRKIIGKGRQVQGLTKHGEEVELFLNIGEVNVNSQTWYTAFLEDLTEKIAIEKRLSREQLLSDAVVSTLAAGIIIIDDAGIIERFNTSAAKIFGYSTSEVKGKNVKILMPNRYAQRHDQYLRTYQETGVQHVLNNPDGRLVEGKRKDGSEVSLQLHLCEVNIDGETWFTGFLSDISLKVQQEKQMAEDQKFNDAVVQTAEAGIIMMTDTGIVKRFNAAASRVFGYSPDDVVGNNVKMLMPERFSTHHDEYLLAYARTGIKKIIGIGRQLQGLRKDGTEVELLLSVGETFIGDQRFYTGFLDDITEQVEAERDRDQQSAFSKAVVKSSIAGIVVIDVKGRIDKFSQSAERLFQYSAEDVLGKNVKMLMPTRYARTHDKYLEAYAKTGMKKVIGSESGREFHGLRKDGSEFELLLLVSEVTLDKETWYTAFMTDISEKKAMEKQMANDQKFDSAVVSTSVSAIIVISSAGIVFKFNNAASKIFGFAPDEVINKNIKMLMPDYIADEHDGYLATYLATGVQHIIGGNRRVEGKTKDGRPLQLFISVGEVHLDGEVWFTGFLDDVTEHAKTLNRQEKEKMFTNTVLETASSGIIVADHLGLITKFNLAACDLFGYSVEEVLGNNVKMLMPERISKDHDMFLSTYAKTKKAKIIGTLGRETTGLTKDGEEIPIHLGLSEIAVGDAVFYCGYISDLSSHRSRLQQAESEKTASLAVMDHVSEAVVVISAVGIVTMFNPAAEDLSGRMGREVIGKNVKVLMPPRVARRHDTFLANYARTGVKKVMGSYTQQTLLHKSGKEVPIRLYVSEIVVQGIPTFVGIIDQHGL